MSTVVTPDTTATIAAQRFPAVRWSAIFCGWLVSMGIAWLLYSLGLAAGFSAADATDLGASAKGFGIGTGVWILLTWVVSMFLGAMFAAWFDGKRDPAVGTLHGIAVWSLAVTVSALLVAFGFGNVLQGAASVVKGGAMAIGAAGAGAAKAAGENANDPGMGMLQAQVKNALAEAVARNANGPATANAASSTMAQASPEPSATVGANAPAAPGAPASQPESASAPSDATNAPSDASNAQPQPGTSSAQPSASTGASTPAPAQSSTGANAAPVDQAAVREAMENIDSSAASAVAIDLIRGNRERAAQRVSLETGLTPSQIDQVMQTLNAKVEQYKAQAKEAADTAAKYSAATMWAVFVAAVLSLIAAALGGWMGARNVHRVYDDYDMVV